MKNPSERCLHSQAGLFFYSPPIKSLVSLKVGLFVFLISMVVVLHQFYSFLFQKSYTDLLFAASSPLGTHRGRRAGQAHARITPLLQLT